ncbi:MAG: hypothetical protein H8E27_15440 [Verrucomicrobia subdivision 3 bacterium]|nr:hypothetical protein [Limisphaerales bacterium]
MMKKLVTCLAVLFLPGCIEFEKQTLVFRHYPKADTLVIWQHYEGIYGEDQEHGLSESEREQLHSIVNGQRTFFFANWAFEFNAKDIDRYIQEAEAALQAGIEPKAKAEQARQLLGLAKLIQKSVTVKNGPFYLNEKRQLSATQQVTVRNAAKIIRETNTLIRGQILNGNGPFGDLEEGDPNIELLEKSAHDKMKYLTLEGQQLRFRLPMTQDAYRELDANDIQVFQNAGITFEHKDNLLIVTAGKVKAKETATTVKLPEVAYQPNATGAVSGRYGLAKDFNPAKARAKFLKDSDARYLKQ